MFDKKRHANNQVLNIVTADTFDHMADVLPAGKQGVASVDHFTMSPTDVLASLHLYDEDYVPEGTYARLRVNGQLMMTDTPMEKRTNLEIIEKARGRVLIAGLGIGMILRAIVKKSEVTHITVLEKYQDVVDLVLPQFTDARLEVIVDDVFQWEPPTDTPKYNTIYFDIWPDSLVECLPEMDALYKRYRPLLAKGGWMDSWTYKKLKQKKASDAKFLRELPSLLEKHQKDCEPEVFASRLRRLLTFNDKLSDADRHAICKWATEKGIDVSLAQT
jgi:spermidine synthase